MGDGYDNDRENYRPEERGRIFENGCDRYFKDRERGYVRDSRTFEGRDGRMQVDKVKEGPDRTDTVEEKSGRVGGTKDETQLKVIRELFDRGDVDHHTLRSVEGEAISKQARELIDGLLRDYPERFTHQIISRADAREIWAKGLQREPGQQLEIPEVGEKARQQRTQQRTRRREERQREERARVQKEAAERAAREFPTMGELLARGRGESETAEKGSRTEPDAAEKAKAREAADAAEKAKKGREAADAAAWQRQREAADRLAQAGRDAREAAARGLPGDMAREAADILRVTQPTPGVEPLTRDQIEAARTRAGRDERGREREIGPRTRH
ncbi:hypothetical protein [Nocardia thraciensis]